MASTNTHSAGSLVGRLLGALAISAILAACGSSAPLSSPGISASASPIVTTAPSASVVSSVSPVASASASPVAPTPSPSAAALLPATAGLHFLGDNGLADTIAPDAVMCNMPDLAGLTINVSGQSREHVLASIAIRPGFVQVLLRNDTGVRYFEGTGVTDFAAGHGAQINSALTAVKADRPGTIGALTHLTGSIDCAGQTTGSASITLTGSIPEGIYGPDPISLFHVLCGKSATGADEVAIYGMGVVNGAQSLVLIRLHSTDFNVFTVIDGPGTSQPSHYYESAAGSSLMPGGGSVDGTAQTPGDSTKVRVVGQATCGIN